MNKSIIRVIGAREHNLQSVTVDIPKDSLVVITGPSGSGKSSLAMDTLYAEGKRRYVESLSSYARQFLGVQRRPDVDKIEGLCPAVAIEQKTVGYNPRSTVGTITEIYDYLRVLFARVGTPHCPSCGTMIRQESPEKITTHILEKYKGQTITIAAPIAIQKKGEFKHELATLFDKGYYRFIIDGKPYRFKHENEITHLTLKKTYQHTIDCLIDLIQVNEGDVQRLQEAIEKAFGLTKGLCKTIDAQEKETLFSSDRICLKCGISFPALEPRFFSFNSPLGACEKCHGLGQTYVWDMESDDPWFMKTHFMAQRGSTRQGQCTACNGMRLRAEARAVTIAGKNITQLSDLPIDATRLFLESVLEKPELLAQDIVVRGEQLEIATPLITEICARLSFLIDVGLAYLTLSRAARTLSGGEGQRIRLATQIGSALSGVLYILDEPSIGLHQRDNDRLIHTLKKLRDQGNTVIVVEHDIDTMREADYIIDMGPQAGVLGGRVTAVGTPDQVALNPDSLTGSYLSGRRSIAVPAQRRASTGFIRLKGAYTHNLKNISVDFPLGVLCSVSGVSGSGKSSLIIETLAPALTQLLNNGMPMITPYEELEGAQQIESLVMVDQSPIGRTPRSNPATYLGIFDTIRALFASLPESNARGYKIGRFSFNVSEGRCFECAGDGIIKVEMHFLEDVEMICKACNGKRYNKQTLEITYKNKNIADVLEMTILQAKHFFDSFSHMVKRLQLLCDVGLDYLTLGQPSTTLSGGEAQRIKLVDELAKRGRNTLYILDEPTTGLHNCDIEKLLDVLNRLVDRGNTVLVIEHNLDVLKASDYIIDIGPEGGDKGGSLVAYGTPEKVAQVAASHTGRYLKPLLY